MTAIIHPRLSLAKAKPRIYLIATLVKQKTANDDPYPKKWTRKCSLFGVRINERGFFEIILLPR
ncbi:hypothetical protein COY25_00830 [Candidatus Uhrbacteria bacterium CG_4_10_14_0_2_um_filter_41_7]|uniref:Uncharacterized protein n=1 Tax=Candidatus Uhrbacteria bacterium CG_4_9_14_3_um_filter_41_35 TaxID=1975034 RepID=A0A2M7XFN5_9BACT|nr:MAG: hypothetical protein COV92_01385 [Candidatus Uhrbacteria bacterium CG11_big_fil_rev_8_21_14_0_20_41_9]PIZ55543.1 MAG: hypothetical protein COY25_00830 [Candidatus Uhrbacteria bacterium CG_4_10_14_0_2_um_filter_41_7]PJA46672.1 MAG: hypothetical protein CO173_02795 [Candidatus Uhrbacteria bacterium CG_4_9_14_3_um_filter_41_35]